MKLDLLTFKKSNAHWCLFPCIQRLLLSGLFLFSILTSFSLQANNSNATVGAIYAMTNDASANAVVAYAKAEDGSLQMLGSFDTQGTGTGSTNVSPGPGAMQIDPLASNYSVTMSADNQFVFAVNAGSNEVTSFKVNEDYSLTFVSKISTVDADPVSIASTGNVVYVACVNGGVGVLRGYTFDASGALDGSTGKVLSGRPTAIRFTKDGKFLAVAQVNNNTILTFPLNGTQLGAASTYQYPAPPSGRNVANPFGLETIQQNGQQIVVVGEARVFTTDGTADLQTSSISTFGVGAAGQLTPISSDIRTDSDGDDSVGPIATCWVTASSDGSTIISSNTNDNSLSNFSIASDGSATLVQSRAYQDSRTTPGNIVGGLTDLVIAGNTVYQLLAADGAVSVLQMQEDGSLTESMRVTDLNIAGGNQGITGFDSRNPTTPPPTAGTAVGAIYAMTNDASANAVVAYAKAEDGSLQMLGSFDTQGTGTGSTNVSPGPGAMQIDPLASNYSVTMSADNQFVFAVNAGSNEVTSFKVNEDYSLTFVSKISTVDADPVSIASTGNVVYVACVNGGVGVLRGYTFDASGALDGSTGKVLSGRPTAIRFTKDGKFLAVAQVNNNTILTFPLNGTQLGAASTYQYPAPPSGRNVANPFGLETIQQNGQQIVVVGEARVFTTDGTADLQTSSISTFGVGTAGLLTPISSDIRTDSDGDDSVGPIATCWVTASSDGSTIISSNTNDNSLSNFSIASDGSATLVQSRAYQDSRTTPGNIVGGLTDLVIAGNTVYQLLAADGAVSVLQMQEDGSLTESMRVTDLNIAGGNQGITGFDSRNATTPPPTAGGCVAPSEPTVVQFQQDLYIMTWDAVPGADKYILQARLSGRTDFAITTTIYGTRAGLYVLPNRTFEYRLQTICADGSSEYSPIYTFTTTDNLVNNNIAQSRNTPTFDAKIDLRQLEEKEFSNVSIYPNPFTNQLTIDYPVSNDKVRINIYHITGKKVFEQVLSKNNTQHTLQFNNMENGAYILSIEEKGKSIYKQRLIKQN